MRPGIFSRELQGLWRVTRAYVVLVGVFIAYHALTGLVWFVERLFSEGPGVGGLASLVILPCFALLLLLAPRILAQKRTLVVVLCLATMAGIVRAFFFGIPRMGFLTVFAAVTLLWIAPSAIALVRIAMEARRAQPLVSP